ncbi:hypothetical protein JW710_02025 [Candidatus Dojkabacteria bacterium]|nr:hypothetical protein [Candidatus Dojkabacteria bacterium]
MSGLVSLSACKYDGTFVGSKQGFCRYLTKEEIVVGMVLIDKAVTLGGVLAEAFGLQPLVFTFSTLLSFWGVCDAILFFSRSNYILHPFLNIGFILFGIGMLLTMIVAGFEICKSRTDTYEDYSKYSRFD